MSVEELAAGRLSQFREAERALLGQRWTRREADELIKLIEYGAALPAPPLSQE